MVNRVSPQFDEILSKALQLTPSERLAMIEELAASFRGAFDVSTEGEDAPFTPEEIAELMRVEPLLPAEVVAEGLLGTWADVADGAEWVNEQKRQRKERRKWSMP